MAVVIGAVLSTTPMVTVDMYARVSSTGDFQQPFLRPMYELGHSVKYSGNKVKSLAKT